MDLFDDRVLTVGFVRGRDERSVVVKNAWNRQVSNKAP